MASADNDELRRTLIAAYDAAPPLEQALLQLLSIIYDGVHKTTLAECARRVRAKGFEIGNIDSTIVAQAPKLAPHIPAMCAHLAADLNLEVTRVNVKATTSEGMGYTGRGEGIAAHAVVLLEELM